MGLSSAVATSSAVLMSLLSGWLALYSWRYVMGAYGISLVVFLMVYFNLPEPTSNISNHHQGPQVAVPGLCSRFIYHVLDYYL